MKERQTRQAAIAAMRLAACLLAGTGLASPAFATLQAVSAGEHPEIIVTGQRYGEAEIASESELDEEAIADYGASSIAELLDEIAPLIGDDEGRPALLVNGERIADPRDISGYPPEALQRLEVLPPEAAGQYGYEPERRVVNLVLKRQFQMLIGEGSATFPTKGGRDEERLSIKRVAIDGKARWNAEVALNRKSELLEADRNVTPVPGGASGGTPDVTLETDRNARGRYRSLLPGSRGAQLAIGLVRPFGSVTASLNLRGELQRSSRLLGLPEIQVSLKGAGTAPLGGQSLLPSIFHRDNPLSAAQQSSSIGLSGSLDTRIGAQHAMLSLVYDHRSATSEVERSSGGIAGTERLSGLTRSSSDDLSAQANVSGSLARLPAGALRWRLNGGYSLSSSRTSFVDAGSPSSRASERKRDRGDARISLSLPIASSRAGFLAALGRVSLDLGAGLSVSNGSAPGRRYSASLSWAPAGGISLHARASVEEIAAGEGGADTTVVETPGVRTYDYRTGEIAEVTTLSGGNAPLAGGTARSFSAGAMLRPTGRDLGINVEYRRRELRNGIGALPTLTAEVEAAFPDRVIRDPDGRLVMIDLRPINLEKSFTETLSTRVNWTIGLGNKGPPDADAEEDVPQDGSKDASMERGSGFAGPPGAFRSRGWGRGRGRGRGPRLILSLDHGWQLADRLQIREGLAPLDRLRGEGGGKSRHRLGAQARISMRGLSIAAKVAWSSAYRTRASASGQDGEDLRFGSLGTVGLEFRIGLDRIGLLGSPKWLERTSFSIDIDNLLDARQRVTRADGSVPPGFLPDDVDPVGRSIRVGLRRPL